eukprot:scaffold884_cov398-Prasinococcus_capsulatus_cf.AAC.11
MGPIHGLQSGGVVASDYGDIRLQCTNQVAFANNTAHVRGCMRMKSVALDPQPVACALACDLIAPCT